jgi:hypothetical protein
MMAEEVPLGYVPVCYELGGNQEEYNNDILY